MPPTYLLSSGYTDTPIHRQRTQLIPPSGADHVLVEKAATRRVHARGVHGRAAEGGTVSGSFATTITASMLHIWPGTDTLA
jgi:hypothetical protein